MYKKICIVKWLGVIAPYIMDSYNKAFQKQGFETFVLDFSQYRNDIKGLKNKMNQLLEWKPDLAVCYGKTGLNEGIEGYFFRLYEVPLVMLHYDCPFFKINNNDWQEFAQYPDYYYHFIWDDSFLEFYRQKGIKNIYKIMLATDPDVFRPLEKNYQYNLSFVGGVNDFLALKENRMQKLPQRANEFLDQLIMAKIENPSMPLLEIWAEYNKNDFIEFPINWSNPDTKDAYQLLHHEGSMLMRRIILESITATKPDVFGALWESSDINFHNKVDYFKELPQTYANSRINLNITSFQLEKSLNNRVFDVAAVGGFILTDFREDLKEVFPQFFNQISYNSIDELNDKISYYLLHDKEREEIASELQKAVLNRHTYNDRVRYILKCLDSSSEKDGAKEEKSPVHLGAYNPNFLKLIPQGCHKILDVGCSDGLLGQILLQQGLAEEVVGLEINPTAAKLAETRLSHIYCVNAEEFDLPYPAGYFDCLTYGDSLEHMKDPQSLLNKHLEFLKPGGYIVCSIPNIRNLFLIDHLLHGNWTYTEWGLLDRTHLRLFTFQEIIKLFNGLNLTFEHIEPSLRDGNWFLKMYKSDQVRPQFIAEYNRLLQNLLAGQDITGELKKMYHFDNLTADEAIEFFTAQFHLRLKKPE